MAEVEDCPQAGLLALVPGHDGGLETATRDDDSPQGSIVATHDVLDVSLQAGEEFGIEDHAVLDDLGQAAPQLASRQGSQGFGIDPDSRRLIKSADQVLGIGMVDPDLAADRAVDLGEQSRRHHDQGKAAGERGGDKAGEVADHAAPQGDD